MSCSTGAEDEMSGRARLPAGSIGVSAPESGAPATGCAGATAPGDFRRETGDGEHAEVVIAGRTYRVRLEELA